MTEQHFAHDKTTLSALHDEEQKVKQYTIFLVDDDPDDRMITMKALKKSPYVYNVQTFESGDKLMTHLAEDGFYKSRLMHKMPVLVVLDVHMPGTDGIGILSMLRKHPMTGDIPVAMATSDTSPETTAAAHSLRANAYIQKPVNLASVHRVLDKLARRD